MSAPKRVRALQSSGSKRSISARERLGVQSGRAQPLDVVDVPPRTVT